MTRPTVWDERIIDYENIARLQNAAPSTSHRLSRCQVVHSPLNVDGSAHEHTAARLQFNGNLVVWMSQINTKWRECSIHWVPVQEKGSKILCGKLEAMQIIPSDCLHTWPSILGVLVLTHNVLNWDDTVTAQCDGSPWVAWRALGILVVFTTAFKW